MKIHLLLAILSGFVRAAVPGGDAENPGMWEKRSSFLRGRIFHTAVWTYSEMIVWGGGSEHQFYNDGGIYDPYKDHWRAMEAEGAPSGRWAHAAVWTGTEMLVWGGRSNFAASDHKQDGALYNPATDTWRPMSMRGAPTPRSQMAAVWTGTELLVWGGIGDGGECPTSGGSYNPRTDSWTPFTIEGAPEGRGEPACVWTGSELIVWGGLLQGGNRSAGTGGIYDPETKKWRPLPMDGAPKAARGVQAVWTGSEMLVWGGAHLEGDPLVNVGLNTGALFNPRLNSWRATSVKGAADGRMYCGAAWTGDELIVWGGGSHVVANMNTGGRYNPASGKWTATAIDGAPTGRGILTAVWTGDGMLIYGGSTGGTSAFNETYFYAPREKPVGK